MPTGFRNFFLIFAKLHGTFLSLVATVLLVGISTGDLRADDKRPVSTPQKVDTPRTARREIRVANPDRLERPDHLLVVLIGGMNSDPTPRQIRGTAQRMEGNSGLYRLRDDLKLHPQVIAEYFNWNGSRAGELKSSGKGDIAAIGRLLEQHADRQPGDRLAVVGNSWGSHTAWEVVQQLHKRRPELAIELAVFLDGSSTGRGPFDRKVLPANISQTMNIFTRNSFVWGKLAAPNRVLNVDLGDPAQGFLKKGIAYNSAFNFEAHVFAEWDERIHALIHRRLLELLPESAEDQPARPPR